MTEAKRIDAHPTKDLFLFMLTKDIRLSRAILDLVDNSVDGAKRIAKERKLAGNYDESKPYKDLSVRVEIREDYFKIADNCGGMSIETAEKYAFRFGRDENNPPTEGSIGQFGVGMKRALFKMGSAFKVESTTENEHFVVSVDVDEWRRKPSDWHFDFDELETEQRNEDDLGTIITVNKLYENIVRDFKLSNFASSLRQEMETALRVAMNDGLAVTLNGIPLNHEPITLIQSDKIQPVYKKIVLEEDSEKPVTVRIYAGVMKQRSDDYGWYIFCNGRSVVEADTSINTGWGEGKGKVIPKAHSQFEFFKGYVYFDSDDASKLPWNTTKTGVDTESRLYQSVRREMVTLMRPVIDYLNGLEEERRETENPDKVLAEAKSAAQEVNINNLEQRTTFIYPDRIKINKPKDSVISYRIDETRAQQVKNYIGATSMREVGEHTFNYFYDMELEE